MVPPRPSSGLSGLELALMAVLDHRKALSGKNSALTVRDREIGDGADADEVGSENSDDEYLSMLDGLAASTLASVAKVKDMSLNHALKTAGIDVRQSAPGTNKSTAPTELSSAPRSEHHSDSTVSDDATLIANVDGCLEDLFSTIRDLDAIQAEFGEAGAPAVEGLPIAAADAGAETPSDVASGSLPDVSAHVAASARNEGYSLESLPRNSSSLARSVEPAGAESYRPPSFVHANGRDSVSFRGRSVLSYSGDGGERGR
ncbi:hypothetical protein HK405_000527, partial [Cladochytrium tenue]